MLQKKTKKICSKILIMAWIESHQQLREHPKVYALMDALSIEKAQTIGHLHLFWWWRVDYSPSGVIKHNELAISRAAEWTGNAKNFVEALIACGWLDSGDGVLKVHDWHDFCGPLIEKRLQRLSERQKKSAERQTLSAETMPTQPNPTKPKRRLFLIQFGINTQTRSEEKQRRGISFLPLRIQRIGTI